MPLPGKIRDGAGLERSTQALRALADLYAMAAVK